MHRFQRIAMRNTVRAALVLSVLSLALPIRTANAGPIGLDCTPFSSCIDVSHTSVFISGSVTYAGGAAPLVGSDITFDRLYGFLTPAHAGLGDFLDVVNGRLDFQTGPFVSFNPLTGYSFAGGGQLTFRGSVPSLGVPDQVLAGGTFLEAFFLAGVPGFIVRPQGVDMKHPAITGYFGLDPLTLFNLGGLITTDLTFTAGGAFSTNATTLDLPNTPTTTASVPEPASLVLLITGGFVLLMGGNLRARLALLLRGHRSE